MRLVYIALISVALLSAACSTAVEGSAVKESGAKSGPTVDISKLDVGPYPTQPSQPLGTTGDPSRGVLVEAQRMANNVIGPWEVDSTVTKVFGFGASVLQNPADLAQIGPVPFAAAAGQHSFINGFVSARTAEGQKILLNAVLRFGDERAAGDAAAEFGDIATKTGDGVQPAQIPGHPDTKAASYTQTEGSTGKQWNAVRAFTASSTSAGAVSGRPELKGGSGAYSKPSWTISAARGPRSSAIRASTKSMPAVTPPPDRMLPSLTMRPSSTMAPKTGSNSRHAQWQAARRPRRKPAAPKMSDPVHTEVR